MTIAEITEIAAQKFYTDPKAVAKVLPLVDDPNEVLGEAKRRGLDVNELVKALEDELEMFDKLAEIRATFFSRPIRRPIHFTGVIR